MESMLKNKNKFHLNPCNFYISIPLPKRDLRVSIMCYGDWRRQFPSQSNGRESTWILKSHMTEFLNAIEVVCSLT